MSDDLGKIGLSGNLVSRTDRKPTEDARTDAAQCERCLWKMPEAGCCICVGSENLMGQRLRIALRAAQEHIAAADAVPVPPVFPNLQDELQDEDGDAITAAFAAGSSGWTVDRDAVPVPPSPTPAQLLATEPRVDVAPDPIIERRDLGAGSVSEYQQIGWRDKQGQLRALNIVRRKTRMLGWVPVWVRKEDAQ